MLMAFATAKAWVAAFFAFHFGQTRATLSGVLGLIALGMGLGFLVAGLRKPGSAPSPNAHVR
jgi:hypothetical protein